jgi:hypothetical protein
MWPPASSPSPDVLLRPGSLGHPDHALIPNGNLVTSAVPDFFDRLKTAVEEDSV